MNFLKEWKDNTEYFKLLELMARLSNIFSDNTIPFLHYRVTENLFCKYYAAKNLSRSDTAYDAKTLKLGVGIKTFQLQNDNSMEKVAEFNSISNQLKKYHGKDLAFQLAVALLQGPIDSSSALLCLHGVLRKPTALKHFFLILN